MFARGNVRCLKGASFEYRVCNKGFGLKAEKMRFSD